MARWSKQTTTLISPKHTLMCIGQFALRTVGKEDLRIPDGILRIFSFDLRWRAKLGNLEMRLHQGRGSVRT